MCLGALLQSERNMSRPCHCGYCIGLNPGSLIILMDCLAILVVKQWMFTELAGLGPVRAWTERACILYTSTVLWDCKGKQHLSAYLKSGLCADDSLPASGHRGHMIRSTGFRAGSAQCHCSVRSVLTAIP